MRRLSPCCLVAIAALAIAACGGTTAASAPAPSAGASIPVPSVLTCEKGEAASVPSVAVAIKDFKVAPQPVTAKVDEAIVWTNNDVVPHTASLADGSCGTEQIAGGAKGALVFHATGTYTYLCLVHPAQMKDFTIVVTE